MKVCNVTEKVLRVLMLKELIHHWVIVDVEPSKDLCSLRDQYTSIDDHFYISAPTYKWKIQTR